MVKADPTAGRSCDVIYRLPTLASMTTVTRDLGVVRLSKETEESTSPERQREIISASAYAAGSSIVAWAEDLDVSASKVHPFKRPKLGPYLTEPELMETYDTLRFWRLDRFIRKTTDFWDMIKWAREHNKNIVSATEPIDLKSDWGEIIAMIIAKVAEIEVKNTSERVSGAHGYMRKAGRYGGMKPSYIQKPIENPDGPGWILTLDPETKEIAIDLIGRAMKGESIESLTTSLNEAGILTPRDHWRKSQGKEIRGARWQRQSVKAILKSPTLLGFATEGGKTLRDSDGMPIRHTPELLSQREFDELQAKISKLPKGNRTRNATLLLQVAFCYNCGHPLHGKTQHSHGKRHGYYHCTSNRTHGTGCRMPYIRQDWLDPAVEDSLLDKIGNKPFLRKVYLPGEDHTEELERVQLALAEVREEKDDGLYDYPGGKDQYKQRIAALSKRVKDLAALPQRPARWDYLPTGETYAEVWDGMNKEERRQLLLTSGITVKAKPFVADLFIPPGLLERLEAASKK